MFLASTNNFKKFKIFIKTCLLTHSKMAHFKNTDI